MDVTVSGGRGKQRDRFFNQEYSDPKIVPLRPFLDGDTFETLFQDAFSGANNLSPAELLTRVKMKKWFRHGKTLAKDVPYPKNIDGKHLPHGAVLNFEKTPIILHSRRALIWWLRLRNVNIPGTYPMESFENPAGGREPGLIDLVQKALETNVPCLTVEQVQRMGALDPVAVQIDPGPWLSLSEVGDGPKIAEIMQQLKVIIMIMSTPCMYACVHVCVHVCMYVCMCAKTNTYHRSRNAQPVCV